jgi:hypothetical protein
VKKKKTRITKNLKNKNRSKIISVKDLKELLFEHIESEDHLKKYKRGTWNIILEHAKKIYKDFSSPAKTIKEHGNIVISKDRWDKIKFTKNHTLAIFIADKFLDDDKVKIIDGGLVNYKGGNYKKYVMDKCEIEVNEARKKSNNTKDSN